MTQVSKFRIDKNIYTEILDTFIETLQRANTLFKAQQLFSNFFTETEKVMLSKRLAAGVLVSRGFNFRDISSLLKMSTATIGMISSRYKYNSGYKKIIDEISKHKSIESILTKAAINLTGALTTVRKGSGLWREINKELKNKKSSLYQ